MNRTIQRAVATCMAAGLASMMMTVSTFTTHAAQVTDFQDVKPTAWYYQAVDYAAREGLFAGTSETTFSPEVGMTRAMFVTVLGRMAGQNGESRVASRFIDVDPTSWYGPYVEWAAEQQIVRGVGNNRFAPEQQITREQLAVMLMKYARIIHGDTTFSTDALSGFKDAGRVSDYAREAMAWAVSKGIISGADGKLMPQGTATRAQAAQMLMNAQKLFERSTVDNVNEQDALPVIRQHLKEILPSSCIWSETPLQAGWYGPYILGKDGTPSQIAEEMTFILTQVDEFTYDVYYITEPTPGTFYLYYG